jgi:hypothetical protein
MANAAVCAKDCIPARIQKIFFHCKQQNISAAAAAIARAKFRACQAMQYLYLTSKQLMNKCLWGS